MEIDSLLAVLGILGIRLAIPLVITIIVVLVLRKVDARWLAEAEQLNEELAAEPVESSDNKDCPIKTTGETPAMHSDEPCWQIYRLPNGYLREACLNCEVFRHAPVPAPVHP